VKKTHTQLTTYTFIHLEAFASNIKPDVLSPGPNLENPILWTMYIKVPPHWPLYLAITTGTEGDYWDMIGKICETLCTLNWNFQPCVSLSDSMYYVGQFIFRGFLIAEAWIVKFIPSLSASKLSFLAANRPGILKGI